MQTPWLIRQLRSRGGLEAWMLLSRSDDVFLSGDLPLCRGRGGTEGAGVGMGPSGWAVVALPPPLLAFGASTSYRGVAILESLKAGTAQARRVAVAKRSSGALFYCYGKTPKLQSGQGLNFFPKALPVVSDTSTLR